MKRLNITLPEKVAEAIEVYGNKSKFITRAIVEKIEKDQTGKLENMLAEGYKNEKSEDKKINAMWEDITLEGWPK